jgi:hypothetical protein
VYSIQELQNEIRCFGMITNCGNDYLPTPHNFPEERGRQAEASNIAS